MRRWIWIVALSGCANSNVGEWHGETYDCVDPAMDQHEFVARLVVEPLNGVGSQDLEMDDALMAIGGDCNHIRGIGLGLKAHDPVKASAMWRCEQGVIDLMVNSSGTGDYRQATLTSQTRRGTDRDPEQFVCNADLYRR